MIPPKRTSKQKSIPRRAPSKSPNNKLLQENPFKRQEFPSNGKSTPLNIMTPANQSHLYGGDRPEPYSNDSKDDDRIYSDSEIQDEMSDEDHVKDLQFGFEGKEDICKVVYHSDKYLRIGDPKQVLDGNKFDGGEEDVYTGTLNQRQQRHGWGVMYYGNGDIYRGDWVNDCKTGKGQYIFSNRNQIDGNFKDNALNGVTVVKFVNGVELCAFFTNNQIASEEIEINYSKLNQPIFKYEGKEPEKDGEGGWKAEGSLLFKNNDTFKGTIYNGMIEGQGRIDYVNGDCRSEGVLTGRVRRQLLSGHARGQGACLHQHSLRKGVHGGKLSGREIARRRLVHVLQWRLLLRPFQGGAQTRERSLPSTDTGRSL